MDKSEVQIFRTKDGVTEIQVLLEKDTVWLNQYQLETLFDTDRTSIVKHIRNIYSTDELSEDSTCANITQVRLEKNELQIMHLWL